jgi:hypothetical protein
MMHHPHLGERTVFEGVLALHLLELDLADGIQNVLKPLSK